jgi:response regulator RpfG family c-di-GMP phosphodiesterase
MSLQKILLVDDDPNILASLSRHLRNDYTVHIAHDGVEAIRLAETEGPIAVMVTDFRMPTMNGVELATRMRRISPDTVRILLTGNADLEMAIDAINQGDIFRFLLKPCPKETLLPNVAAGVQQYLLVIAERELLDKTLKGSIKVLIDVLSMTNPEVFNHSTGLRNLVRNIALRLEKKNLWEVELAVSLCQIGCVTLPKEILQMKSRNHFNNDNDRLAFYLHPKIGKNLVGNIPRLESIAEGIAYQYKYFNGEGYPVDDLRGEAIPWLGRLLKVVLDYDDLTHTGVSDSHAVQSMTAREGQYDPQILAALRDELGGGKSMRVKKPIPLDQLEPGMILASNVTDFDGRVLITQKTLITDVMMIRLVNYKAYHQILEPIFVFSE